MRSENDVARAELKEMYSRFGWKWAALASVAGTVIQHGNGLPHDFIRDLRLSRTRLESGCYSLCDISADLRDLEVRLFPLVLKMGTGQVHAMLELISKAMAGSLCEKDIDSSAVKAVLADCSVPNVCQEYNPP